MSLQETLYSILQPIITGTVIWDDQNAPRPQLPYTSIKMRSRRTVKRDFSTEANSNGVLTVFGDREFTLSISRYQKMGAESVTDFLQNVVDKMRLPSVVDTFMFNKLVPFDNGNVLDTSALLDKTQIEKRATLDIFFRYKSATLDEVGFIDTVKVEASDDSGMPDYEITATSTTQN
jgi:hypothetical protein